jgi:DNA polymerase III subunit epsilon
MNSGQLGYAVIDLETTGLQPSWHDRIIEVAVVALDPLGRITGEWSTLVNPERDLGAQHIHGIRAADVRHAPSFKDIAGALTELLCGRVPVAHNLRFDVGFLHDEYARTGIPIPDLGPIGICTMTEAVRFLPNAEMPDNS